MKNNRVSFVSFNATANAFASFLRFTVSSLLLLSFLSLVTASSAYSQTESQSVSQSAATSVDSALAEPSFGEVFMQMLPVYALVIVVYYLMVLKPQQKKVSAQQEFKSSLKKGDSVVTSSGILGRVSLIEDDFITLEIAPNTKVKFEAKHIAGKAEKTVSSPNAAIANG